MEEQKRRVASTFDLASVTYDEPALRCFDLHALALVRQAQVLAGAQVLDVATGTGKVALAAARETGNRRSHRIETGHRVGQDQDTPDAAATGVPTLLLSNDVLVAHLADPELGLLFARRHRRARWL